MMGGRTPPAAAVASSMRCRQVGMCAGRLEGRQDSRACWEAGWRLEVWLWFRRRLCSRACLQRRAEPGFLVQRVKVACQRVVLVAELRLGAPAADVEVQHDLWQGGAGDTHRAERQREPAWGTHKCVHTLLQYLLDGRAAGHVGLLVPGGVVPAEKRYDPHALHAGRRRVHPELLAQLLDAAQLSCTGAGVASVVGGSGECRQVGCLSSCGCVSATTHPGSRRVRVPASAPTSRGCRW